MLEMNKDLVLIFADFFSYLILNSSGMQIIIFSLIKLFSEANIHVTIISFVLLQIFLYISFGVHASVFV